MRWNCPDSNENLPYPLPGIGARQLPESVGTNIADWCSSHCTRGTASSAAGNELGLHRHLGQWLLGDIRHSGDRKGRNRGFFTGYECLAFGGHGARFEWQSRNHPLTFSVSWGAVWQRQASLFKSNIDHTTGNGANCRPRIGVLWVLSQFSSTAA